MATALAGELPVREVVLYKHGVGFFGRSGEAPAGEPVRLDFQASEMNDVLKSLVVTDRSGNPVLSIRYDSSEPLSKKLGLFPFRVDGQVSLAAFLDQLKGARIELRMAGEAVTGTILSARVVSGGRERPDIEQLLMLNGSGELRTVDLSAASAIRFSDLKLQEQLREYLGAMNQARSRDKRSVWIEAAESGRREIAASYLTPAAIWKSSYRLLFGDQGAMLEGWAIVDNTTGEDWTNVRLALVSGRPISFVSPLYEPRYRERPVAEVFDAFQIGPITHAGAVEGLKPLAEAAAAGPRDLRARQAQIQFHQGFAKGKDEQAQRKEDAPSSVAPAAEARELGELFEYRFARPVTVKQGESAMLPFLQQKVTARKLLVYAESMGLNPMYAAEILNSTGKTLDGGPLTVFEPGGYGGEALIETLKAGDKRLVSYGVDLGTRVATAFDSGKELLRELRFRRSVLTTKTAFQETKTYTIRNVDAKPKTLIVEHPKRPQYELVEMKPAATTAGAWRFEVTVKPESVEKFKVTEERIVEQTVAVTNLTPDVLLSYALNKSLTPAGRQQLEQIAAQKRRVAALDKSMQDTEAELRGLVEDENRLRQNIYTLNNITGQRETVQKYATELTVVAGKLTGLRDQVSALRKQKTAAEAELAAMIEKFEF